MTDGGAVAGINPVPLPEPPAVAAQGPADWVRRNLFGSVKDGIVTLVSGAVVAYALYRLARYVFVTGRWDIVRVNLKLFLVGRYPADDMWRIAVVLAVVAAFTGLAAGAVDRRRRIVAASDGAVAERRTWWQAPVSTALRLWPLVVGVALLLLLSSSTGPWLTAAGIVAGAVIGRMAGPFVARLLGRHTTIVLVLVGVAAFVVIVAFLAGPIGWEGWGGIMLNTVMAIGGITLCFPLGVLLALGRRSKLPLIRWLSVGYIELFRGIPLYVLLLLTYVALGLFWPPGRDTPGLVVRAVVAFTLFTAAYVAEIVRGGLQSLPKGQTEAAQALGLTPVRTTFLIVLPQALRNVIPALVGQFISLFKDTTLAAAAMGLLDLYNASGAATSQNAFQGQNLTAETLAFVMLLFWVGCITMSRESQRLERKLGVGTR